MKRFYKQVSSEATDVGHNVLLDGRPVKTPAKVSLTLPNTAMAAAVVAEWSAQKEDITPNTMPITQLACTVQDRMSLHTAPDGHETEREKTRRILLDYAHTDLLLYRSMNTELARRQAAGWQPWLNWIAQTHQIELSITDGLMPIDQPQQSMSRIAGLLDGLDDWHITGFMVLCPALGSFVLAWAVLDKALAVDAAASLATLDEAFQEETWGFDKQAREALDNKIKDMIAAADFLQLLQDKG